MAAFQDEITKIANEPVKRLASFKSAPQEKSIAYNQVRGKALQGGVTPALRQEAKNIPEAKQLKRSGLKPGDLTEKVQVPRWRGTPYR